MGVLEGLLAVVQPVSILVIFLGAFVGIIIGILPGIGAGVGMALMLPLVFSLSPMLGLVFLAALWSADGYGSALTSILINVPGGAGAVVTCLDGYPMSQQGKAGQAIGIAIISAAVGSLFGVALFAFAAPFVASFAVRFGPAEYFLLAIFGLTIISTTSRGAALKGLIAAGMGLAISFIGYDLISGFVRFSFGSTYLYDGIEFTISMIGIFALGRMLALASEGGSVSKSVKISGKVVDGMKIALKHPVTLLRSSIIGSFLGTTPGVGIAAATAIAYSEEIKASKHPEKFGTGLPEGVVAPIVADNAVQGGSLIPTLTLGIPGSSSAAIFLGGLIMYGISPGMDLFQVNGQLVWAVVFGLVLTQVAFIILGLSFADFFAKITIIPGEILVPIVLSICFTGAYSTDNNLYSIIIAMFLGIVGYMMVLLKYPAVPAVLGIILGPIAEKNYYRAMLISDGSHGIFYSGAITQVLLVLIVISLCLPFIQARLKKRQTKRAGIQEGV